MDYFFVDIKILPMLITFNYYMTIFINLNYFTLHYLQLFMVIFNYFWFFLLFHPRLLLVIQNYFWLF